MVVGKKSQKKIREFFFGLIPQKVTKSFIRNNGYNNEQEFWESLSAEYKRLQNLEARRKKTLKQREKREQKRKEKETSTLEQLDEVVNNMFSEEPKTSFTITLKSYKNPASELVLKFKNIYHWNTWYNRHYDMSHSGKDSQGNDYDEVDDFFARFTYVIEKNEGGSDSNVRKEKRTLVGKHYDITIRQLRVQHNNCGIECVKHLLNLDESCLQLRKAINSKSGSKLSPQEVLDLYNIYNKTGRRLTIHMLDTESISADDMNILFDKEHFSVIDSFKALEHETDTKVKHGMLFWDIETRETEDYCLIRADNKNKKPIKSYYIKDVILHAYYRPYKCEQYKAISFTTNENMSSCRQFLNWLMCENKHSRYYQCYAHNGGNFDTYFLMMNFTKEEAGKYSPSLRGTTIIKLEFGNNIFLDTYCFLPSSLSTLSEDFKVQQEKLKRFEVNGKVLTNEQLCFYKPHLKFFEFIDLQNTEPEFWELYNKYCLVDCIALQQIWSSFSSNVGALIEKWIQKAPHRIAGLSSKCKLNQSCTIGGHAQKILNILNGSNGKASYAYKNYLKFIDNDKEKHDFIMANFKRGGISHCNQKGKHCEGVMSVDICSQYPASMKHMYVPSGQSEWTVEYDVSKYGFYILKNLRFDTQYSFKPVCEKLDTGVLKWDTSNTIESLCVDSYMIKYLQENYGLISFEVEKGLVSNYEVSGESLFGDYVDVLFGEKAQQDKYKYMKDERYNPSYRETIKLYLNAVTGKLVMDKDKYSSLKFTSDEDVKNFKEINGVKYQIENKETINNWVTAGVMVYSYSKRLLFEYIKQLPNNSDDVIHVETDSIYFPMRCKDTFKDNIDKYVGSYPVQFGNELGNVKIEKEDNGTCYFLNKKVYTIGGNYIWKGIPKKTINVDGTEIKLLGLSVYENVYNHKEGDEPITVEFATLQRTLFGKTGISAHRQQRTLNSSHDYKEYV